ncbi:MAG: DUF4214 domain-containing protein [Betaproteobacteria bacterium]|nr:DUF4214 domain-containing protein [Betaproteobacteria bacterium]
MPRLPAFARIALALFAMAGPALATAAVGPLALVRNIASGAASGAPQSFAVVGNTVYFSADNGVNGRELWKSDGTFAGTVLVKDIAFGPLASDPSNLVAVGSTVYFRADDGVSGVELWKTDGTAAGTVLVGDINAGLASSNPTAITAIGNTIYFNAETAASARELWKSDGTTAGTVQVAEILAGTGDANPRSLTVVNGTLYFVAADAANGIELWKSDGTTGGTQIVKDIRPGATSSSPAGLVAVGGTLYFNANDGTNGVELWKSDGTLAGTVMVSDLTAGAGSTGIGEAVAYGGQLLFVATTAASGSELWKSDGTAAGTVLVKDIAPGAGGSTPASLTVSGDKLFLVATDGTTGREPWVSDGSAAGTVLLKDIHPSAGSFPTGFVPANGVAYFTADDGTNGREIWRTDGTGGGTTLLAQTVVGAGSDTPGLAVLAGGLLYLQATSTSLGTELHKIPVGVPDEVTIASIGGVTTNPVDFAPITITGIDHPVPISVEEDPSEPGSNPMYSVGCTGTFTDLPGLVSNGQSVCVRHTQRTTFNAVSLSTITKLVVGPLRINAASATPFPDQISCTGRSQLTFYGQVHSSPLVCQTDGNVNSALVYPGPRFAHLVYDASRVRPYEWLGVCAGLAGSTTSCPFNTPASIGHAYSYPTIVNVSATGPGSVNAPPADLGVGPIYRYFPTPRYQVGLVLNPVRTLAFTATPDAGAVIASLTLGTCSAPMNCACDAGTGICSTRVVGESFGERFVTLDARFGYELGIGRSGAGAGSVNAASNFATGDCTGACTRPYPSGTVVTLTATAAAGSVFTGWSGEGCSGTGTCAVTIDAARNVTAAFALQAFALAAAKAGDGSGVVTSTPAGIACGATCSANFDFGTVVTLSATPAPGSIFVGWSGACSALLPCVVTMDAAKAVTASFAAVAFPLAVSNAGTGAGTVTSSPAGINCGSTCAANFNSGASVALTPSAAGGSIFAGWSGACTGTGTCNVTMDAAKNVTATFNVSTASLSPSPASLDFGGQSFNTTAPSLAVVLTNSGGAPVTVSSVTPSTYFAVTHNCSTVAAGASCTANVAFTPTAEGSLNGTLTVQSSAGNVTVPLAGTGERSLVTHYYRSILRRAPDAGGKAFWESEKVRLPSLGANVNETWYAMATFFYFSSEYQSFNRDDTGFVSDLYSTFFNRPADGGGLTFWTGLLAQGMPREVVLVSFMFSTEFQTFTQAIFGNVQARKEVDTVVDFYRGLLSRLPDDSGLASWVGQFRAAQCAGAGSVYSTVEAISSSFANGGEYASRNRTNAQYVGDLYNAFLRRGGDLDGVQFWISQLTGGATRSAIRQQFIASPEFTNRVNAIIAEGCVP